MKPNFVWLGLFLLISLLHSAKSKFNSYNEWKNSPNVQYHIQSDEGGERYFKYQTESGQYRKEKRLQDGTVIGTYGWVDSNGYLRLRDYVADKQGYRIIKTKLIYVGKDSVAQATPPTPRPPYSSRDSDASTSWQQPPQPSPYQNYGQQEKTVLHDPASAADVPLGPRDYHPDGFPETAVFRDAIGPAHVSSAAPPGPVNSISPTGFVSGDYPTGEPSKAFPHVPSPPPISTEYLPVGGRSYFLPGTGHKRLLVARRIRRIRKNDKRYLDKDLDKEYDGIATVQNGFRYFLPKHYHEESSSPDGANREGSFGYIDPFGIRRVVYYNASPEKGFVHKKNNRYVGFSATPYDPRPNY